MTVIAEVLGNRYEVGRLLGAGGMADVHEGVDRVLGRRVAIKIPHPQLARDPLFVARFKREATLAASLTHPSVVAVYDTGQDGDTSFIVMEYVEGATLAALLRAEGPLEPDRAAELVAEVCGALGAAHAKGLIHRDIKPGNIMCTGEGRVKVMDFGVARMLAASMTLTESAGIVGTAKYMSPEQAQGVPVDARSDLYSLGVVLYECLGGRPPFDGDSPVVIASRHVWATPAPLGELQPDVPPALEAVTYRALAKDPGERYQHAAELAEDLERARAGRAVAPPPPDGAEQVVELLDLLGGRDLPDQLGQPGLGPGRVVGQLQVAPVRVGHEVGALGVDLVAVPGQVEVAHQGRGQQADHVGERGDPVVGPEGLLGDGGAPDHVACLADQGRQARPGQVGGGDQAVVAAADDDGVVLAHAASRGDPRPGSI
jgi:tRNA A-37 threonylcarbamoyl transferase component Bud32